MRRRILSLCACALLSTEASAWADDAACIAAARNGQKLRAARQLLAAREQFLACAMVACPRVVRSDCDRWFAEIDTVLPTIVVVASERGQDVVDVDIAIDDKPVAKSVDGKSFPIDPGPHLIRATRGGRSLEQRVVIAEGEKTRRIAFVLDPPASAEVSPAAPAAPAAPPAPTEPASRSDGSGSRAFAWAATGIGTLALGSFAYFGIMGKNDYAALRGRCSPACSDDEIRPVHDKLLVADISLTVAVVAAVVATVLFVTASSGHDSTTRPAVSAR